jgi:hypothetical protein
MDYKFEEGSQETESLISKHPQTDKVREKLRAKGYNV